MTTNTVTQEVRAARQSVRAKIRKALAVPNSDLSAGVIKHLESAFAVLNEQLKPVPKAKKPAKAKKAKAKPAAKAKTAKAKTAKAKTAKPAIAEAA